VSATQSELIAALETLAAECQAARGYIVLTDEGFALYNSTADAIEKAREVIRKATLSQLNP
jgi:hypothetical protein